MCLADLGYDLRLEGMVAWKPTGKVWNFIRPLINNMCWNTIYS